MKNDVTMSWKNYWVRSLYIFVTREEAAEKIPSGDVGFRNPGYTSVRKYWTGLRHSYMSSKIHDVRSLPESG